MRMTSSSFRSALVFVLCCFAGIQSANAGDDPVCASDEAAYLEGTAWLRSVSLDLRGVVPTVEEYDRLDADGNIPDDLLDEWLASEEFANRVVRHHKSLLWNNMAGTSFFGQTARLYRSGDRWYRRNVADRRRGARAPCLDWENEIGTDGRPVEIRDLNGFRDDGWVWRTPYWSDTPIKVCTYDAMEMPVSPRGTDCSTSNATNDPDCGCGPDLVWCIGGRTQDLLNAGFTEDVDRRIRTNILEDRPYTEVLTGNKAWVNGPMVHYLRHMTRLPSRLRLAYLPYDLDALPDLSYDDVDTWVQVDLGPEQSGVFTSPAFLIRFQTNRSRANRFSSAFLCQDFQAPAGGLPAVEGVPTLDLTARDGCKYCHAILEPTAAHWGRWSETGASYLDPQSFPAYDEACARCGEEGVGCDSECRTYYLTNPLNFEEEPYMGWLFAFEFLEERHHHHPDEGPKLLVKQGIVDGRLPECVASKAAEALLHRPMGEHDTEWVDGLTQTLEGSNWSYRQLMKAVVTSENYRRLP